MVKDNPIWISLPMNVGGRLADLTDWASGSQVQTPASFYYGFGAAAASAISLYGWWMWSSRPNNGKLIALVDPHMQTRQLPDGSRVGKYLKSDVLMRYRHSDATTLYEAVRRGARVSKNGPMLGHRVKQMDGTEPYVWIHYNEVIDRSINIAKALRHLGLPIGQETFIGLYAQNRPEWIMIEQGTYGFNNVLVPLYETLGAEACGFIINQTEIQIVFCDSISKLEGLLAQKSECKSLEYIVLIGVDQISNDKIEEAAQKRVKLFTLKQFENLGMRAEVSSMELTPPNPEDLATICYTSGTTGTPKGVMLTHGNVIADSTTADYLKNSNLQRDDVMISFLPLAHMFERILHICVYMEGGAVGFFRGDIRLLPDDIKTLRPTILPVVPRVLNRIYDKVLTEVNKSKISKLIFDAAIAIKSREMSNWIVRNDSIIDNIVFKKIRENLGGRVKLMLTGSAPLSETVLTFIRCALGCIYSLAYMFFLGCIVIEGYGQTECCAASTITIEGDFNAGHVGIPAPCNAIKLIDVPELGYFAKEKAGEVCIRGTNVFKGYYRMPEQTQETLDSEGWLHTGDIGRWTNQGTLKIVDRKKHIFKLAQGEYVAPEKIENIYMRSKYVAQCFVYGESLKTCLIGIIVPDPETIHSSVKSLLNIEGSIKELCERDEVKKLILDDIIALGKKAGLFTFEQVKNIYLCPNLFTVDNDLLTPTLKTKRPKLKEHFKPQIEAMYKNLD